MIEDLSDTDYSLPIFEKSHQDFKVSHQHWLQVSNVGGRHPSDLVVDEVQTFYLILSAKSGQHQEDLLLGYLG